MGIPQASEEPGSTIEEYLSRERAAEERSEYFEGKIVAMAGESQAHGLVCVNLTRRLLEQMDDSPCLVLSKDTKVRSGDAKPFSRYRSKGMFSYPDVVVVCGEPEFYDENEDIILNPKVVFEVLSPSTEGFDRSDKFERYRTWNPTLTDYILVAQNRAYIEHHHRVTEEKWTCEYTRGMEKEIVIESISCTLKLAQVYQRVAFPPKNEAAEDGVKTRPT